MFRSSTNADNLGPGSKTHGNCHGSQGHDYSSIKTLECSYIKTNKKLRHASAATIVDTTMKSCMIALGLCAIAAALVPAALGQNRKLRAEPLP